MCLAYTGAREAKRIAITMTKARRVALGYFLVVTFRSYRRRPCVAIKKLCGLCSTNTRY